MPWGSLNFNLAVLHEGLNLIRKGEQEWKRKGEKKKKDKA